MIKWLTRITISHEPSQSFYHYHDNRVLPSSVDQERADREDWWRKPEYIINDLNLNSAITHPVRAKLLSFPLISGASRGRAEEKGASLLFLVPLTVSSSLSFLEYLQIEALFPLRKRKSASPSFLTPQKEAFQLLGCIVFLVGRFRGSPSLFPL